MASPKTHKRNAQAKPTAVQANRSSKGRPSAKAKQSSSAPQPDVRALPPPPAAPEPSPPLDADLRAERPALRAPGAALAPGPAKVLVSGKATLSGKVTWGAGVDVQHDIDVLVARWRGSRHGEPRPAASGAALAAFRAAVVARFGFEPAADFVRFLELCDGGLYDAVELWGLADGASLLDRSAALGGGRLYVGASGHAERYVLCADGHAEIVGDAAAGPPHEAFTSFTALVARLLRPLL